jgi:hypothetical protein
MATEAGDQKLLGNYRKLIDLVTADANYNPANADITKPSLAAHYTGSVAALDDVAAKNAPNKMATSDRQAAYDPLSGLMRRSFNMLKASGASKGVLEDAQTHLRKVTGARKSPKKKADPATPPAEDDKQHSASQMSFDNRRGNVAAYVAILANVPSYNPNENELKVSSLQALVSDLDAKNNAVSAAYVPLSRARGVRDGILYLNDDSVVNRAALVKAYVQAAFGRDSQLFKQIKGLDFRRPKR